MYEKEGNVNDVEYVDRGCTGYSLMDRSMLINVYSDYPIDLNGVVMFFLSIDLMSLLGSGE